MAELTNITEDENQKTFEEQSCSSEFTEGVHGELVFLSAINVFFSVAAFLGNTLILIALHKESSLHPPSKLLYRNLAVTDLCVGIIVEPLKVASWISMVNKKWRICYYVSLTNSLSALLLCTVSLFTLTALSLDRLLALFLGLRYRQVVTLRSIYITEVILWILAIIFTFIYVWIPFFRLWLFRTVLPICLVTSVFSYTIILVTLRHNQNQVQNHIGQRQPSQAVALNTARYRKAVYSALWVQVALVVCYLPSFITAVVLASQRGKRMSSSIWLAWQFTATLIYLNSPLNPLLYYWEIREVRQAVKETLGQFFRLSS
ncbi:unnamed protein product [Porites evermanni]|uniref:G-protein coupled receptors family 1 profile domain-containing protein n=1 Tax=Porites evermanni TaxID=104178 RepID=A0ABN8SM46_9CNID|nr:unnamed protein product [Porites evermanni]